MAKALILVAASGLARETAESARLAGWDVVGCLDDDETKHGTEVMPGLPVLGGVDSIGRFPDVAPVVCAGKGAVREALVMRLAKLGVPTDGHAIVVDPSVVVPPTCSVGAGSILLAGVTLTASVTVGRHVVCMPRVVLTHDVVIEDFATLCAGVVLGGSVTVGRRAYLGMASSVREQVSVGSDSVLGMGAVAVTDLAPGQTAVGVPAVPFARLSEGVR